MDNAPRFDDAGPVRPAPHPAGRHRRQRAPPTSSTCSATACACTSTSRATAGATPHRAGASSRASTTSEHRARVDLLGNGTACLVWSSPLPGDARRPLRYVDLMGGSKPHLLVRTRQQPGRRDPRRLRAVDPVLPAGQARRQALDHPAAVPGARGRAGRDLRPHQPQPLRHPLRLPPRLLRRRTSASSAASAWSSSGTPRSSRADTGTSPTATTSTGTQPSLVAAGAHQDLVPHRRFLEAGASSRQLRAASTGPSPRCAAAADAADARGDAAAGHGAARRADPDEEREACRALKGAMLRRRSMPTTAAAAAGNPYTVTEQNFTIRLLQPQGPNRHAVFFIHPRESARLPLRAQPGRPARQARADPGGRRLRQRAAQRVDRLPAPRRLRRRRSRRCQPPPERCWRYDQAGCTSRRPSTATPTPIDDADMAGRYRTPLPSETVVAEITGVAPAGRAHRDHEPLHASTRSTARLARRPGTAATTSPTSRSRRPTSTGPARLPPRPPRGIVAARACSTAATT